MLNRVVLIGRTTRPCELRYTQSGKAVSSMTLAVDKFGEKKEADFIDIVCWNKLGEITAQYLIDKGRLVAVEGRLSTRSYEASDGSKRKVYEVVADNVRFLDKPKESATNSHPAPAGNPFDDIDLDNDLPF